MTILIIPQTENGLTEAAASVVEELNGVKHELQQIRRRLQDGDFEGATDAGKMAEQVRRWIFLAIDVEKKLVEHKRSESGVGPCGYALDLEAARSEIGCRLHRVRRCCDAD